MNTTTLLPVRPLVTQREVFERSQAQQRALKVKQSTDDLREQIEQRQEVPTDADAVADRAWPQFDGWIVTLMRAQSNCGAGRNAEMRGDLEDLERLIGHALRGAA